MKRIELQDENQTNINMLVFEKLCDNFNYEKGEKLLIQGDKV